MDAEQQGERKRLGLADRRLPGRRLDALRKTRAGPTLWQQAEGAPAEAERFSRLGDTWRVEGEATKAEQYYRKAHEGRSEAWGRPVALAMLYAEQGLAAKTRSACQAALEWDLPDARQRELRTVLSIIPNSQEFDPPASAARRETEGR